MEFGQFFWKEILLYTKILASETPFNLVHSPELSYILSFSVRVLKLQERLNI